jgi:hypothetical protein
VNRADAAAPHLAEDLLGPIGILQPVDGYRDVIHHVLLHRPVKRRRRSLYRLEIVIQRIVFGDACG